MPTWTCPSCSNVNGAAATQCPRCGFTVTPMRPSKPRKLVPILVGVAAIAVVWLVGMVVVIRMVQGRNETAAQEAAAAPAPPSKPAHDPKDPNDPGEKPLQKSWNDEVPLVDRALRARLRDPDSLEYVSWDPPAQRKLVGAAVWIVRVTYRAKNGFGGYNVTTTNAIIRHDAVTMWASDEELAKVPSEK